MTKLNFSQDYVIFTPKKEGIYPLPESDWRRLKGLIGKILPERKIYNFLASLFFGISVSSFFSLVTFYTVAGLQSWILPTNWSIFIAALILGIVLLIIDSQQKTLITISRDLILGEMQSLEERYVRADG